MNPAPVECESQQSRRFVVRYVILSVAIFLPLFWAFAFIKNMYPVAASTMMMEGGMLERERTYYILRGETISGHTIEISPGTLTGALYGRMWGMVAATARNENFKLRSLHPANALLLSRAGTIDNLPQGARVPELLKAWGTLYNEQAGDNAQGRLRFIRLDSYKWEGTHYADYDKFIQTWRVEL